MNEIMSNELRDKDREQEKQKRNIVFWGELYHGLPDVSFTGKVNK